MILRDPVHGLISFGGEPGREGRRMIDRAGALAITLLDTPEVQRLRRIRALGMASLVYPGGEHSRFAHAVGSAHVMQRYLERVAALGSDLCAHEQIDADTAAIAMAAALLHDLGHGPLSHTFELLLPGVAAHEHWTSRIVLDPDSAVNAHLRAFDPAAPAMVEGLIRGQHPIPHLARAVSGTFDVDRCDYLMRDSYMTGVRYGSLDLEWLLGSLRLYVPAGETGASLAVDGEKGLTAVEGFFLARLYMYRQVYLHKAARAAEVMMQALFARLIELGPQPGTPPVLEALLRNETISTGAYLELDDNVLAVALASYGSSRDAMLRDLAERLRARRLYKTMGLRPDADSAQAQARLEEVLRDAQVSRLGGAAKIAMVDRLEVDAYVEDHALVVLDFGGRVVPLLDASPVLRGLSREVFVHHRAIFPPEIRAQVEDALRDFT